MKSLVTLASLIGLIRRLKPLFVQLYQVAWPILAAIGAVLVDYSTRSTMGSTGLMGLVATAFVIDRRRAADPSSAVPLRAYWPPPGHLEPDRRAESTKQIAVTPIQCDTAGAIALLRELHGCLPRRSETAEVLAGLRELLAGGRVLAEVRQMRAEVQETPKRAEIEELRALLRELQSRGQADAVEDFDDEDLDEVFEDDEADDDLDDEDDFGDIFEDDDDDDDEDFGPTS